MSDPVRFHLSLNVADLTASVGFFRTLFGEEPAKLRNDYAKFEPSDPPLVLSLEPSSSVARGGALNHLGFRLPDAKTLVAMQERLERSGLRTKREEGVECCYAKQTKFWAHDPDGNLWEIYTFDGDIDHRGDGQSEEVVLGTKPVVVAEPTSWEHRMNEPVPERLPQADSTLDEVRLRGTFNSPLSEAQQNQLLAEARRVLKPGGRLFVHVLTGDRTVDQPDLPGPAGGVRVVPTESAPVQLLERHGFAGVRLLKYDAKPCFVRGGVAMRETQIEGFVPSAASAGGQVEVLYKGPYREIRTDDGELYTRGERKAITTTTAAQLRSGDWASQFVVFPVRV
jgi:catechol 2,3-dioxygenase-like lactoylglutathione lyase family enzyme